MSLDTTLNLGHLIQLAGYVIVAIGLYYGIRIDLIRQSDKNEARHAEAMSKCEVAHARADDAHVLAGDAHNKIYEHVTNFHIDRRP